MFSAVILMAMVSCSGNGAPEKIYDKIQAGDEITQEDYHQMIDYLKKPVTEALAALKEGAETGDFSNVQPTLEKLDAKYPYVHTFSQCIAEHYFELDDNNKAEFDKLYEDLQNLG